MSQEVMKNEIDKVPGLRAILNKCQEDIEQLTKLPVTVYYRIKFHHLSSPDLIRIICEVCDVSWEQIKSNFRKSHYVIARQLYCWFAFQVQKKKLCTIAEKIGRDHTSVIHSRDKVQNMIETNDELYMEPFQEIQRRIDEIMEASIKDVKPTNA